MQDPKKELNRSSSRLFAISDQLAKTHSEFIARHHTAIKRRTAEREMLQASVGAKLHLICKALKECGAISSFKCVDMPGMSNSFHLWVDAGPHSMLVLNDGHRLVVAPEAVVSVCNTMFANPSTYGESSTYYGCDSDDFEWEAFALGLLETVHRIAYAKAAVYRDDVLGQADSESPNV